jgi:hypothetical protein
MPEVRTVVTFEDPMFNTSERKDYFINECCYGDDLAHALMDQLRSHGIETAAEPGQEDFGWYIGFRTGHVDYQFVIGHRPAEGADSVVWIGWLERKAGLLGAMFGARNRGIQPDAASVIDLAISSLPEVSHIRWHRKKDFDAGLEKYGRTDPSA